MIALYVIVIAFFLDLIVGDPRWFYHPVIAIGKLVSFLEKKTRKYMANRIGGFFIVLITITVVFFVMFSLNYLFFSIGSDFILKNSDSFVMGFKAFWIDYDSFLMKSDLFSIFGISFSVVFLCTCFSTKCLADEAKKVKYSFTNEGIEAARIRLSYIVGRETSNLDEKEIIRATVETVAENTVDGTISPMFYAFLGAFVGMLIGSENLAITLATTFAMVYKAINTMDSMIGYKNEKYIRIGMVAARLDDVANFIPARLSVVMFTIGSLLLRYDYKSCFKISIRDRKNHKSPNCAYSEGAVAGSLGIELGGDNVYFGEVVKKPTIGDKKRELDMNDINKSIRLMYISCIVGLVIMVFLFAIVM